MFAVVLSTFISMTIAATYLSDSDVGNEDGNGKSTYYGGNTDGNACGFFSDTFMTDSFPFGYYAACGSSVFNDGYGCGKCYEVTCLGPYSSNPGCSCSSSHPTVIVQCRDQCPECSNTHLDLDPTAMARIVGPGLAGTCGVIKTTVKRVSCEYSQNIQLRSKGGVSAYWYGLYTPDLVKGQGSITKIELKSSGSSSYSSVCLKNEGPSFYKCNGGYPLQLPLSVRLTNDAGATLTCNGCITSFGGDTYFNFGSNFGGGSSGTSPSTTTTTTTTTTTQSSGGGSSSGSMTAKQNGNVNEYWMNVALEIPYGVTIQKLEIKGSNRDWEAGFMPDWCANCYSFEANGQQFSGPFHFRVTVNNIPKTTYNVFTSVSGGSSGAIQYQSSSYTEEDGGNGTSGLTTAGVAAIIVCLLLCILCIGVGIWFYKKNQTNKGVASFQETGRDTPVEAPQETNADAEIEVEMNVTAQ